MRKKRKRRVVNHTGNGTTQTIPHNTPDWGMVICRHVDDGKRVAIAFEDPQPEAAAKWGPLSTFKKWLRGTDPK